MQSTEYDWITLAELGVGKVVSNLVAPSVRDVNTAFITPEFANRLRADGLDAALPLRVRRSIRPRGDVYIFEQIAV
jgi:hypothetical protein